MLTSISVISQDIHFSHFHASPLHQNPSFAGVMNGKVRIIANYRNQWQNITAKYNTFGLSADFKVVSLKNRDFFAIGVAGYMDKAGDLNFTNYTANLSLAYTKSLSSHKNHAISFGIYGGILQYGFDITKANGFDSEPIGAGIPTNKFNYDIGAGIGGFFQVGQYSSIYGGFAAHHLNRPNMAIFTAQDKLPMKFTSTLGAIIANRGRHAFMPNAMFVLQGTQQETTTGAFYRFEVNQDWRSSNSYFYIGGWARWHVVPKAYSGIDAAIVSARYDVKGFQFTFSYDINVSKLAVASKGNGGPEVSIAYIYNKDGGRGSRVLFCPKF